MAYLVGELKLAGSTIRGYQTTLWLLCDYVTSPHYQWPAECEARFGTHPVQICHEWKCATRRCCFRMEVEDPIGSPS
ncbi:hypothetical protein ABH926_009396 [Catenulispora sp. GP43]|uniref:hypothetical protein n=1 Tax=Catenulispora sp. GP43 TaxID=3156263 RepID=UPI003518FF52